jgi:hypothetical protein
MTGSTVPPSILMTAYTALYLQGETITPKDLPEQHWKRWAEDQADHYLAWYVSSRP